MGSVLSGDGRETARTPDVGNLQGSIQFPQPGDVEKQQIPSFDCAICLEVFDQPVRTKCGHVFCHTCITTCLRNHTWTCPYCRAYLPSEGIPATDIIKMMKNIHQNCTECKTQVCLSEMRAHLKTCDQYIEKYGPLQELAYSETRYPCPLCQNELDENDLLDHFLTFHRTERQPVYCPICRLLPSGGPSYYIRNFIRHLQLRHTFYYEDYIDINIVEEVLIERVLDRSVLDYVHLNNPGTA
ncbi:PREDICTED: E3 ubiquitin-protein ligase RNF125 [Thamnophis sirtalis]|uniref:RING-type E3 ubiquitin transferase n=1 Tax=Thamnophis sirtalis TaxID=35019 RepID=A0A6I9YNB9_9SAUR|nr:PREDICTED: E3 ubiquitin-protein ligase RNF125 [Thamnophis sirtalis]